MRLSDQAEPYAVVVIVPRDGPGESAETRTVNGRVAKMIAWLLDNRVQVEHMHGSVAFNCGPNSFQPEIRETFPHQSALPSVAVGRVLQASQTQTFPEEPTATSK